MGLATANALVTLPPAEALELWTDVERWSAFIDGFARAVRVAPEWPTEGSELTWESTPEGRGRVRERVEAYEAPPPGPDVAMQSLDGRLATRVDDGSLTGVQIATFTPVPEGTRLTLELEYELSGGGGPLRALTDVLFIRRAIRDALRRTVARFAAEARAAAGPS